MAKNKKPRKKRTFNYMLQKASTVKKFLGTELLRTLDDFDIQRGFLKVQLRLRKVNTEGLTFEDLKIIMHGYVTGVTCLRRLLQLAPDDKTLQEAITYLNHCVFVYQHTIRLIDSDTTIPSEIIEILATGLTISQDAYEKVREIDRPYYLRVNTENVRELIGSNETIYEYLLGPFYEQAKEMGLAK